MKKIAKMVYENLTPRQRVVACIEAVARGDDHERRHLVRSCPKVTYVQTGEGFSETMERLMGLAIAVEADLRECVLRFLVVVRADPEASRGFLQDFANVREAWKLTLAAMGIDKDTMAAAGPPSSSVFEVVEDLLPEPDTRISEMLSGEMLACLG